MISANGGLPAHRYTPQVTPRWPRGPNQLHCPPRRPSSLPLCLRRRCRAPPPLGRGHPRRLPPRRGGGWLVPGSWGLGGDELAGVRVDVVEVVVVVVVVVVVGVVRRHLLDAGGDAPHWLHVRLQGPFPYGPLSSPLAVPQVPPPVPQALARPLTHLPSPCPLHLGSLPVPLRALPVPWPLPGPLP